MSATVENQVDTHENQELIETVVQCTVVNLYNHTLGMKMSWRGSKHKVRIIIVHFCSNWIVSLSEQKRVGQKLKLYL